LMCQDTIREAAYRLQDEHNISVSTPLTHVLMETETKIAPAKSAKSKAKK